MSGPPVRVARVPDALDHGTLGDPEVMSGLVMGSIGTDGLDPDPGADGPVIIPNHLTIVIFNTAGLL